MKRSAKRFALNIALIVAPALLVCQQQAHAATVPGMNSDVEAVVWQEDADEFASVSLNGKELVTFRGEEGSTSAKAEELASRLQELFDDRRFDAGELLPYKSGAHATVQRDGITILTFEPLVQPGEDQTNAVESSWKLVNGIRAAFGAPTLPPAYLKLVEQYDPKIAAEGATQGGLFSGQASWYGGKFHGRKTSNGRHYDQEKLTAAHRSLPFGTRLLVMNRKTGSTCIVEVNDRGPFVADRVIDLSRGAAKQLNMLSTGVALVDCLVLSAQ